MLRSSSGSLRHADEQEAEFKQVCVVGTKELNERVRLLEQQRQRLVDLKGPSGGRWKDKLIDDCQVTDWMAKAGSECSKKCGGGQQELVRSIRQKNSALGVSC